MALGRFGSGVAPCCASFARGEVGSSPPRLLRSGILEPLGVLACSENDLFPPSTLAVGSGVCTCFIGTYLTSNVPSLVFTLVFHLGLLIKLLFAALKLGLGIPIVRFPVGVVLVFLGIGLG